MPYPIAVELDGRRVLVVGAGAVATRKVQGLLKAGARVHVVAPRLCDDLEELAEAGEVTAERRRFTPDDVRGATLVFAATDDADANDAVVRAADAAGVLANSATGGGGFDGGAVARAGSIEVAVWTGGSAGLAVRLRDEIEGVLDERWGRASGDLARLRAVVSGRADEATRRAFWRQLATGVPDNWRTHAQAVRWVRSVADAAGVPLSDDEIENAVDGEDS